MKNYIVFTICLLSSTLLFGQVEEGEMIHSEETLEIPADTTVQNQEILPELKLITTMTSEGMKLRWAPTVKEIWYDGIDHGYILEKMLITSDTTQELNYKQISNQPIKPWSENQWKTIAIEDKPYYVAAAQCLTSQRKGDDSGFVVATENQENIFGIQLLSADLDWVAAVASGLGYLDTELSNDKDAVYIYRLSLADSPISMYQDTIMVMTTDSIKTQSPPIITNIKETENRITLEWTESGRRSSGYHIERSANGTSFERLTKMPYINATTNINAINEVVTYIDSIDQNYVEYQYRVIGIDAFARETLPSDPVTAMGRDATPPSKPFNTTVQEIDELAIVTWDWKDDIAANDLAGFMILRSQNDEVFDTLTTALLPPTEFKFIDPYPNQVATNFYKVLAVDQNGNSSASDLAFLITSDDVPPAAPTNLSADIDTTGGLLLTWTPPADEDVRGYLVHFSNSLNSDFAVVAGEYLPDSFYIEQLNLNTLTESIYYYVVALDLSYNPSIASEIIEVKKPDIVPPAPSIFTDYKVSDKGIYFEWVSSNSSDLADVILERKEKTGQWQLVEDFDKNDSSYLDKLVEGGVLYEYRLVSIDDDGNKTYSSKPLALEALTPFFIKTISKLEANKTDGLIKLNWEYKNADQYSFVIYRKQIDGKFKTIKKIDGINYYEDNAVAKNKDYQYTVKAISKDGRESKLSDPVTIN